MERTTSSDNGRGGRVKLRSIGVQTDLRLAIRCVCDKVSDKKVSQVAKKAVRAPPTESVTVGIKALGTPNENTKPKSSKRKGDRNLSQKGCSEDAFVDSGDRDHQQQQQQQRQSAKISARLRSNGGLDADKSKRNHGNKAGCSDNTSNKQAGTDSVAGEKKIGQSAADSPKPIRRLAKQSIGKGVAGGSLAIGTPGVNNYTSSERDINANVQTYRLVPTKMEQSQAGSNQPPTARCQNEPKPPHEQLNQKHALDTGNQLVDAYLKLAISKPVEKQNKGAQRRLVDQPDAFASAPFSSRSMSPKDEQQQPSQCETGGGNGGRNIIYLTNRDQYELRAKLIVDAVPFRMPGS